MLDISEPIQLCGFLRFRLENVYEAAIAMLRFLLSQVCVVIRDTTFAALFIHSLAVACQKEGNAPGIQLTYS